MAAASRLKPAAVQAAGTLSNKGALSLSAEARVSTGRRFTPIVVARGAGEAEDGEAHNKTRMMLRLVTITNYINPY